MSVRSARLPPPPSPPPPAPNSDAAASRASPCTDTTVPAILLELRLALASHSRAAAGLTSTLYTVHLLAMAAAIENAPTPPNMFRTVSPSETAAATRCLSVESLGEKNAARTSTSRRNPFSACTATGSSTPAISSSPLVRCSPDTSAVCAYTDLAGFTAPSSTLPISARLWARPAGTLTMTTWPIWSNDE